VGIFSADPIKFSLGVIYTNPKKATFEENITAYEKDTTPVIKRERDLKKLQKFIDKKKKQ